MPDRPGPMTCPVDGTTLTMSERQGIEIDYCPQCRGVWLDRGELDKILERNAAPAPISQASSQRPYAQPEDLRDYDYGGGHGHGGRRRKKSFLSELFD